MQSLRHHSAHLICIPLIAWVSFSLACMNKMKQSRGININAIITGLGATQNHDNSRRLASRKKKKSSLHLLLHSSWTDDMLRLAISARKVYRLIYITAPHSWMGSKSKEEAWIWLRYVREIDVMKCPTALWCESSVLLQESKLRSWALLPSVQSRV